MFMAETQKKAEKTNFEEMIAKKAFVKFQPMSGGPTMIGYVVGRDADKKLIVKIKEHNKLKRLLRKTRHEYRVEEQLVKPLEKPAVVKTKPAEGKPGEEVAPPKPPEEKPMQPAAGKQWREEEKEILAAYPSLAGDMSDAEKYAFTRFVSGTRNSLGDVNTLAKKINGWQKLAKDGKYAAQYPDFIVAWEAFRKTGEYGSAVKLLGERGKKKERPTVGKKPEGKRLVEIPPEPPEVKVPKVPELEKAPPRKIVSESDRAEARRQYRAGVGYGKQENALVCFTKAIALDPNYKEAYRGRGLVLMGKMKYSEALADFNMALRIDPNYSLARKNKAAAEKEIGEYKVADKKITLQAIDPYIQFGQFADAEKEIGRALKNGWISQKQANTKRAEIHLRKGTDYTLRGDKASEGKKMGLYTSAESEFTQSINLNPTREAYTGRGYVRGRMSKLTSFAHPGIKTKYGIGAIEDGAKGKKAGK
ncbi:Tetratricopeptide repeat protein [Candidatus Gugararchaeum adminiculabundum]|nr:Tetratricopeptide repeat protein [Candidatus Gugararchaeum adminiculabundum]